MHAVIDPAILYFGTPVALISSLNADGSANLAPMSSLWWLGKSCLLGFGARSETPINIQRTGECVINLPSVREAGAVDRLAKTSASEPLPAHKTAMGYRTERDKFGLAGMTPVASDLVSPPRAGECPVQMEAILEAVHPLAVRDPLRRGSLVALELRVARVHVHESIRLAGHDHRIDPDRWRPLVMSFQHFYGLGEQVHPSTLATIAESSYRRGPAPAAPVPSGRDRARAAIP